MPEQSRYPLISVIIPTYNRAGLIVETIESVRDQSYTNWELIIVDDGSDDNTEEVVRQLKDNRIHFIKMQRSGVGGKLRNTGIKKTTGELIAFVDSDDLWDKTKLEKQVAVLQEYPGTGFCLTNGYNFRTKGEPLEFFYKQRSGLRVDDIFVALFRSEVAGFTQALLFKKECLEKTGLFDEEEPFSDVDFIVRLASHFKAAILYEPLVFRRLHQSSHSLHNWEQNYWQGVGIIRSNRSKLPSSVYRNALFRIYMNYGEKCLLYKQRLKAVKKFGKGWSYKLFSIVPLKKMIKAVLGFK